MNINSARQNQQLSVTDYLSILWRRKIWVAIPTILGIAVSIFLIKTLPKTYRSSTLILVEGQKVPEAFIKSAVSGSVEGRLSTIRQQILSRSLLQKMIKDHHLYADNTSSRYETLFYELGLDRFMDYPSSKKSTEEIIESMRKKIEIKTMGRRNTDAFSLSFQGSDPTVVMNVTNDLASRFIEQNLKIREQLVEGTTTFLDNELKTLQKTLELQEKRLGDFKRKHMGELPGQLDANLRGLDRFQSELLSTHLAQKTAQDRILLLKDTIKRVTHQINEENRRILQLESQTVDQPVLSADELILIDKKRRLETLRIEYKESYPDIVTLKNQIEDLEIKIARRQLNLPPHDKIREDQGTSFLSTDLSSIKDFEAQIKNAQIELGQIKKREKRLRGLIKDYERRVENAPALEQEMAILVRDYDNTQKNYQVLLDKKLNAKISENLEKRQKGERFHIIDPANFPEKPVKPDPQKVGFAGILFGLGSGLALAFVREQFDGSLRKSEEIEEITGAPILVSIPDFTKEMKGA